MDMNFRDWISDLHEKTDTLKIFIANGYPKGVGIRAIEDSIGKYIIDDICNLIYGEISYRVGDKAVQFHNIDEIREIDPNFMNLRMGAQSIVKGHLIRIDLGNYIISSMVCDDKSDRIIMEIHRDSYI